ncbi:hypothetical protein M409DRAFT_56850 [Zasmidium cellare ATCC 36951]|uniref:O-methyltransferase C-terminal domain-containing protein n=1 Tax=Zasmidium cellare ATCC 36951 TaxID=1080233 RepID=A0A6A6CBH3_ZASCE|nr:uncharacterized protein M409DRAFT_56850 [Zasmidium cellare ATCC 36951]KAF2164143.1 hypothetical protein M409DRAFT_56850 [Zasmidium cellare ATCC 36951]
MATTAASLRKLAENPPSNAAERRALYDAAKAVMFAVEAPIDTEHRLFFVASSSGSRVEPYYYRLLRYVAAIGLVKEVSEGTFAASNLTATAATKSFKLGLDFHEGSKNLLTLPKYLSETGYRNPTDPNTSLFAKIHGAGIMDLLQQNPERAATVFEYMAEHRKHLPTWMNDAVSTKDFEMSDIDHNSNRIMMVDVGGGSGHQCFALRAAFPQLRGKMVVQDITVMVDMIDKEEASAIDLEPMAHDFFTPQPVKHAKVYYMRNVLHDWSNEPAAKILQQLRPAMTADSVVVIDEIVIPPTGANHKLLHYDFAMMSTASSMERTEKQWRALVESCGMKLRDIWVYDEDMQWALIVAVPN